MCSSVHSRNVILVVRCDTALDTAEESDPVWFYAGDAGSCVGSGMGSRAERIWPLLCMPSIGICTCL